MSQFDKITFASQLFWFTVFFFSSYFVIIWFVLPQIYSSLRVREWRLSVLDKEVKHLENELFLWSYLVNSKLYKSAVERLLLFFSESGSRRDLYVELARYKMSAGSFKGSKVLSSSLYLNRMSEILVRQRLTKVLLEKRDN
jgi:hypothetical protein